MKLLEKSAVKLGLIAVIVFGVIFAAAHIYITYNSLYFYMCEVYHNEKF